MIVLSPNSGEATADRMEVDPDTDLANADLGALEEGNENLLGESFEDETTGQPAATPKPADGKGKKKKSRK